MADKGSSKNTPLFKRFEKKIYILLMRPIVLCVVSSLCIYATISISPNRLPRLKQKLYYQCKLSELGNQTLKCRGQCCSQSDSYINTVKNQSNLPLCYITELAQNNLNSTILQLQYREFRKTFKLLLSLIVYCDKSTT